MAAHRWLIAAAAHAAFRRLALRGPLRLSLVARPPPTSCAWSSPPARSCATSNCSAARPPARPPSPPARLTPSILLARGRQSRHTTTSLPLTPPHDAQPVHSRRQGARNAQFGLEMPPPRVGGALGSGAAPRRANLRDKLATSVPRIHPRFCPIQAHPVPRATSRAKFAPFPTSSSRPNADLRPPGGPGRGSGPARCGFSTALRCICAPMARSGVRLRRVDCEAPR